MKKRQALGGSANQKQLAKMDNCVWDSLRSERLYRYCLSLTRTRHDAEDLMQEALMKAELRRQRVGEADPLEAYSEALLLRIARNSWIDQFRRTIMYRDIMGQEKYRYCQQELQNNSAWQTESSKERMAAPFQVLVEVLSPQQRVVLLMRDVLGYSAAECAEYMQTTTGAVKSLLFRARRALELERVASEDDMQPMQERQSDMFTEEMVAAYEQGDIELLLQLVAQANTEAIAAIRVTVGVELVKSEAQAVLHTSSCGMVGSMRSYQSFHYTTACSSRLMIAS